MFNYVRVCSPVQGTALCKGCKTCFPTMCLQVLARCTDHNQISSCSATGHVESNSTRLEACNTNCETKILTKHSGLSGLSSTKSWIRSRGLASHSVKYTYTLTCLLQPCACPKHDTARVLEQYDPYAWKSGNSHIHSDEGSPTSLNSRHPTNPFYTYLSRIEIADLAIASCIEWYLLGSYN